MYNFIHQNLKTIQELNDQNNNDGNDMGCERDNVGRPINDFTWFSIKNYMISWYCNTCYFWIFVQYIFITTTRKCVSLFINDGMETDKFSSIIWGKMTRQNILNIKLSDLATLTVSQHLGKLVCILPRMNKSFDDMLLFKKIIVVERWRLGITSNDSFVALGNVNTITL